MSDDTSTNGTTQALRPSRPMSVTMHKSGELVYFCDHDGAIVTHEHALELIDRISRFYATVSVPEIHRANRQESGR